MTASEFFAAINSAIALQLDAASVEAIMTTELQSAWTRGSWQVRSLQLEDGTVRFYFFDRPGAGDPLPIHRVVPLSEVGARRIAPDIAEFLLTGSAAPHHFWE